MKRGIVRREEAKHERNQTVMPLHKSSHKAPRLDPTMISAPLGDFRHTMHIGRGGDAFGDTSFLATVGPSPDPGSPGATATNDSMAPVDSETPLNHTDDVTDDFGSPLNSELQHSGSVSSFTLDMDFDLGPSIMGDVLGVMDGLGLDSDWTGTRANEEDVFSPSKSLVVEVENFKMAEEEQSVSIRNELNEKKLLGMEGDGRIIDGEGGIKAKGLRPKVRFSDKREEIIRQASEEEGQGLDGEEECVILTEEDRDRGNNVISMPITGIEVQHTNHKADSPSSPASSHSSEYEGVNPLDRRRVDNCHSETDSEEEEEEEEGGDNGRGYTFEDEFDDEIGL
ncbi:cdc42 effector protein 5 [Coregonus clupeaformis]|uniref:cdc42 effector protein 5 n=1 Tax=Coregonus clupeaformis TaxID=59861 RepID=UPI001BE04E40|nr:cdc42 effector protein 5 [Coregonus clupeaformis]